MEFYILYDHLPTKQVYAIAESKNWTENRVLNPTNGKHYHH